MCIRDSLVDLLFRALARHVHAIAAAGGRMVVGMGADLVPLGRHALDRLHVIGLIGYLPVSYTHLS